MLRSDNENKRRGNDLTSRLWSRLRFLSVHLNSQHLYIFSYSHVAVSEHSVLTITSGSFNVVSTFSTTRHLFSLSMCLLMYLQTSSIESVRPESIRIYLMPLVYFERTIRTGVSLNRLIPCLNDRASV